MSQQRLLVFMLAWLSGLVLVQGCEMRVRLKAIQDSCQDSCR